MPGSNAYQPPAKHIVDVGNRRPAPVPKQQPVRVGKTPKQNRRERQNPLNRRR